MFKLLVILFGVFVGLNLISKGYQGHSKSYREYLNQPKPEWLKIGKPTKAKIVDGADLNYPPMSGTVIAYPTYVLIPAKNVKITFQDLVSRGTSWGVKKDNWLSPNGKRLVVQTGAPHMYEIGEGSYQSIDFYFPKLTYDTRLRGQLYGWNWASDDVLVGSSELVNPDTGEYESTRIYVYHAASKILSRLNLEGLNLGNLEGLEIVKIGSDANHIQFRIGNKLLTVEADLKTPPKLLTEPHQKKHSRINPSSVKRPSSSLPQASTDQPDLNNAKGDRWPMIIAGVLLLVILALLFKVWKGKSAS